MTDAIKTHLLPLQRKANAFLEEANAEVDALGSRGHLIDVLGKPLYGVLILCQDSNWTMKDIKPFHQSFIDIIDGLPDSKHKTSVRSYIKAHEELLWAQYELQTALNKFK